VCQNAEWFVCLIDRELEKKKREIIWKDGTDRFKGKTAEMPLWRFEMDEASRGRLGDLREGVVGGVCGWLKGEGV